MTAKRIAATLATTTALLAVPALATASPAAAATATASSYKSCGMVVYDDAVYAGASTSCSFARNVYRAMDRHLYWYQSGSVSAYSPATGRYYRMYCRYRGSTTRCSGGNHALVDVIW